MVFLRSILEALVVSKVFDVRNEFLTWDRLCIKDLRRFTAISVGQILCGALMIQRNGLSLAGRTPLRHLRQLKNTSTTGSILPVFLLTGMVPK